MILRHIVDTGDLLAVDGIGDVDEDGLPNFLTKMFFSFILSLCYCYVRAPPAVRRPLPADARPPLAARCPPAC